MEVDERYEREDLSEALRVLEEGGVILYPTDTIWGIGCDATNAEAVQKVFELKHRASAKALISIVDSSAKLQGLIDVYKRQGYTPAYRAQSVHRGSRY